LTVDGDIGPGSFDYGEKETMEVHASIVLRDPRAVEPPGGNLDQGTLCSGSNSCSYTIHAGYRRVLQGLLKEIEMIGRKEVPVDECAFRGWYLVKVLDSFVKELELRQRKPKGFRSIGVGIQSTLEVPHVFRSRALNPILQRQLHRIPDNESALVKKAVGTTMAAAQEFYLSLDPLHPNLARRMFKNLLYISPVRSSLVFFNRQVNEGSWRNILLNTKFLLGSRSEHPAGAWNEEVLYDFEIEMIGKENLGGIYQGLINASVSSRVDSVYISSPSYVSSGNQTTGSPPSCCPIEKELPTPAAGDQEVPLPPAVKKEPLPPS